ncbi:hypothetical protein [Baaleninema simplex]|uniref:hypothetical protein n=1 Tax=Baaleninema simplex TaxID=2862350 RepID=UPI00035C3E88|nr:hypothetical protein [Baaleninema simplex]
MKNALFPVKSLAIAATLFFLQSPTIARADGYTSHLYNATALRNTSQLMNAGLTTNILTLHVHGSSISQVAIELPRRVSIERGVSVVDENGNSVDASVTMSDRRVTVAFSEPVTPNAALDIHLRGVKTRLRQGRVWLYPVSVRTADSNRDISIGNARIHTY